MFGGDDGIGLRRWGVWQCGNGLQGNRRWKGDLAGEFAHNLRWRDDGAFLGRQGGEGLRELSVAVVLPGIGGRKELLCGGQFSLQQRTIAAVCAPGDEHNYGEAKDEDELREAKGDSQGHG